MISFHNLDWNIYISSLQIILKIIASIDIEHQVFWVFAMQVFLFGTIILLI